MVDYDERLSNYKDVAERITDFREKHPEGSLQPHDHNRPFWIETIGDKSFVVYGAAAYRDKEDSHPGIGYAWEPFPGTTPYTRNSELQNAETSAWGRAIVAALASEAQHIASAEEVRNRIADEDYVTSAFNGPQETPASQPTRSPAPSSGLQQAVASAASSARQTNPAPRPPREPQHGSRGDSGGSGGVLTEKQRKMVWAIKSSLNWDLDRLNEQVFLSTGVEVEDYRTLTGKQASQLIEDLVKFQEAAKGAAGSHPNNGPAQEEGYGYSDEDF